MAYGFGPIGSAPIGGIPEVLPGAEFAATVTVDIGASGELTVTNSGDLASTVSVDFGISAGLSAFIDLASSVTIDIGASGELTIGNTPFDFPNAQYPSLLPLEYSFTVDELESELKQLFIDLYRDLLSSKAFDVNVLGAAHLGSFDLVHRSINEDGLVLLPGERENASTRYLYRAWKSRNVQGRGLHFLRTYLQLLFPNFWTIDQMMQDKAEPYPTALFPQFTHGSDADKFLTSRIQITIDAAGSTIDMSKYISSVVSVIPARLVPRFVLTTNRGTSVVIAAQGNMAMTLRAISNVYSDTYYAQLIVASRGNLSMMLRGSGTVYETDTPPPPPENYAYTIPNGIYAMDTLKTWTQATPPVPVPSFIKGYLKRTGWGDIEKSTSASNPVYDFSVVDAAIAEAEASGKLLTLVIFAVSANSGAPIPDYVTTGAGSETWINSAYSSSRKQVMPWNSFALTRWQAFCQALADHKYNGVRLADLDTLAQIDCSIGGTQGVRILGLPDNYTAAKYKQACIDWVSAMADRFQKKNCYVGMFGTQDGTTNPNTADDIRDTLANKYDGVSQNRLNFYQELLTGINPSTTSPLGKILLAVKDRASIMFQTCWALSDQQTGTTRSGCTWATSDNPQKCWQLANNNYNSTYFEFYNDDLKNSAYQAMFTQMALDIQAKYDSLRAQISGQPIGYVGASMTMHAVDGAITLGDTRLWNNVTGYGGGGIAQWLPSTNNAFWNAFAAAQSAKPAKTFWWELCAVASTSSQETLANAILVVNEIKRRVPGATVYVSAQPTYTNNHTCTIAGSTGPSRMATIAAQLVSGGHCSTGPVQGPLNSQTQLLPNDTCHPNTAGEAVLGQQLIDFFNDI